MEIEHVVIRRPEFVAGSKNKPEVGVFVQTHSKHIPLNLSKLKSKQTVWMKWASGPIVAKSKILSWHEGIVKDGDIKKLRELTLGTNLFGLDKYWEHVAKMNDFYFVVIRLCEEEWLEKLIYPKITSNGSSWVYMDTEEKRKLWLSNYSAPIIKHESERNIPVGIRFDIFRRDNFTCIYCGRSAPNVELHVDHKIPWKIVKKHELNNLFTACKDCNLGKTDKIMKEIDK
ncbi:MAG: HNH endonuclease [Patescibacteria group bacterium]